jgi:transcriptional regulator with XRE-family HTH domain
MADANLAALIGQNLRRYRKQADLSQEELGFRASLHPTAIGQLERAERVARADTLVKLAGALDIPSGALLEGISWRQPRAQVGGFELTGRGRGS